METEKTHINYASLIDPEQKYPVSYTIKQDGEKVYENTWLLGKDLTENQIKQIVHFGYSTSLLNQIEALKKENERARELLRLVSNEYHTVTGSTGDAIKSFLNEQKPEA